MFTSAPTPRSQRRQRPAVDPRSATPIQYRQDSARPSSVVSTSSYGGGGGSVGGLAARKQGLLLENEFRRMSVVGGSMPEAAAALLARSRTGAGTSELQHALVDANSRIAAAWDCDEVHIWRAGSKTVTRANARTLQFDTDLFSSYTASDGEAAPPPLCSPWHDQSDPGGSSQLFVSAAGELSLLCDVFGQQPEVVAGDRLPIPSTDYCAHLREIPRVGFAVFTNFGTGYIVEVQHRHGRVYLAARSLGKPASLLNKVSGWISGSVSLLSQPSRTLNVELGGATDDGGRELLMCQENGSISSWSVSTRGQEQWLFEENVMEKLNEEAARHFSDKLALVTLLKFAPGKNGRMFFLLACRKRSFTDPTLALAWLDRDNNRGQRTSASGFLTLARGEDLINSFGLSVANGGPIVFVHAPNLILLLFVSTASTFCETIPFKSTSSSRIVCAQTDHVSPWSLMNEQTSTLWLLVSSLGVVSLEANTDKIAQDRKLNRRPSISFDTSAKSRDSRLIAQLKSQLEQAIFLGAEMMNPIAFNVAESQANDMGYAAAQLSMDIMHGESKQLATINDVKSLLMERVASHERIFDFLYDAQIINQIPTDCLKIMLRNALMINVTAELWHYHNTVVGRQMAHLSTSDRSSLLDAAINSCLSSAGRKHVQGYASVRNFFQSHVDMTASLVPSIVTTAKHSDGSLHERDSWQQDSVIMEAAIILLIIYQACSRFELDHSELFATANYCSTNWLGTESVARSIDDMLALCRQTYWELKPRGVPPAEVDLMRFDGMAECTDVPSMSRQLAEHICLLTDFFLQVAPGIADEPAVKMNLAKRRHEIIMALVKLGMSDIAIKLAAKCNEYQALVELIHADLPKYEHLIAGMLSRFSTPFATVLCDYYLSSGQFRKLLQLQLPQSQVMEDFLTGKQRPDLLWVYKMHCGDYLGAADIQMQLAATEQNSKHRANLASLAKLSTLAARPQLLNDDGDLDRFDRPLDLVRIQRGYAEELRRQFVQEGWMTNEAGRVTDQELARAASALSARMGDRPVLRARFHALLRRVMADEQLDAEELIEVLTVNFSDLPEQCYQFSLAAELLAAVHPELPRDRCSELAATIVRRSLLNLDPVWRRYEGSLDGVAARELDSLNVVDVMRRLVLYAELDLPQDVAALKTTNQMPTMSSTLTETKAESLRLEYERENLMLDYLAESHQLVLFYAELLRTATLPPPDAPMAH